MSLRRILTTSTALIAAGALLSSPALAAPGPTGSGPLTGPIGGSVFADAAAPRFDNSSAEVHRTTEQTAPDRTVTIDVDTTAVVGVTWDGEDPSTVYRVKQDGEWQDWHEVPVEDGAGPEPGSAEAAGATDGTEPLAVTDAEQIQIRSEEPAADTDDMRVDVFSAEPTTADREIADSVEEPTQPAPTPSEPELPRGDSDEGTPGEPSAPAEEAEKPRINGSNYTAAQADGAAGGAYAQTVASSPGLGSFVSRKEWGANESLKRCEADTTSVNRAVTIHHTAGASSYSKSQVPGILRGILSFHTQSRGWCDVGYNMLVDRFGTIYEGRAGGVDRAIVGAHAGGFNTSAFGVAVMGTYSSATPWNALGAIDRIIGWQAALWGYDPTTKVTMTSGGSTRYPSGRKVSLNRVFGHRDVSTTDCPGNGLYSQLSRFRTNGKKQAANMVLFPIAGAIGNYYRANNGMERLGAPTGNERGGLKDGGALQQFQRGSVHWTKATGAHATQYAIRTAWGKQRWENGRLGYPINDERKGLKNGGSVQNFQGGSIHWSSATGANPTWGGIRNAWRSTGWENGKLGYPRSWEQSGLKNGGAVQHFQGGDIHWSKASGAHPTWGGIRTAWGKQGYETGRLGYPTSGEYQRNGVTRQDFQGGYIEWRGGKAHVRYN